jgi:transposase
MLLRHLGKLDPRIDDVSAEIAARRPPMEARLVAVDPIPGNGQRLAEVLIAEVGAAGTHFPSTRHLRRLKDHRLRDPCMLWRGRIRRSPRANVRC